MTDAAKAQIIIAILIPSMMIAGALFHRLVQIFRHTPQERRLFKYIKEFTNKYHGNIYLYMMNDKLEKYIELDRLEEAGGFEAANNAIYMALTMFDQAETKSLAREFAKGEEEC